MSVGVDVHGDPGCVVCGYAFSFLLDNPPQKCYNIPIKTAKGVTATMKTPFQKLTTPFEGNPNAWGEVYPRPQMARESFFSLCGTWALSRIVAGTETPLGEILVPFPPESRLSGVEQTLQKGEKWLYRKTFTLPADFPRDVTYLHFGAVDQIAEVTLNGVSLGTHKGGYLPFSFDVTSALQEGENTLSVTVTDDLDKSLPYGKQRVKRGGMWYTPVSGIWQPVWMESVPENHISSLKITSDLTSVIIETRGGENEKTLTVTTPGGERKYTYNGDVFTLTVEDPRLWSPEDPYLYRFCLQSGEDVITSYFALRTVTAERVDGIPRLCLNGKPYFFHGLLDQGYFSDGIYLPASPAGYVFDVKTAKELGFNTLRKHIKIEPEEFYYQCDLQGVVVFQDMVNGGKYRYVRDTVLPTVGMKKRPFLPFGKKKRIAFESHARETVALLQSHPSVCYYTIFNEGWGQYDADRIFGELKALDPTRIWDATSGWFTCKNSDVDSRHVYFRPFRVGKRGEKPLVLSEFGGYSCKLPDHSFNLEKTYGYKTYTELPAFEKGLEALYREQILPAVKEGLCAAVLTQLSDVEDETNGLVTYDRRVVKVEKEAMQKIGKDLQKEMEG